MEFNFEFEDSDLVVEFESDFVCENYSSTAEAQWQFQNRSHTGVMANVFYSVPKCKDTPVYIYPLCDCSVDVMRDNYDNSSMLKTLNNQESVELGVLVRLKCNQYTINMEEQ